MAQPSEITRIISDEELRASLEFDLEISEQVVKAIGIDNDLRRFHQGRITHLREVLGKEENQRP